MFRTAPNAVSTGVRAACHVALVQTERAAARPLTRDAHRAASGSPLPSGLAGTAPRCEPSAWARGWPAASSASTHYASRVVTPHTGITFIFYLAKSQVPCS